MKVSSQPQWLRSEGRPRGASVTSISHSANVEIEVSGGSEGQPNLAEAPSPTVVLVGELTKMTRVCSKMGVLVVTRDCPVRLSWE